MGNFVNKHLMLILMFIIKEYLANEMDKYTTMLASGNPQVMIEVQSEIQKNYAKAEVFFGCQFKNIFALFSSFQQLTVTMSSIKSCR